MQFLVADGTPRDCSSNGCGSQADTAIIRDREIESGEVGPLGRTQGNGPVDAAAMISVFMGEAAATSVGTNDENSGVGVEDDLKAAREGTDDEDKKKRRSNKMRARQFNIGNLFGGGGGNNAEGVKAEGPPETIVADTAGAGADSGLPTANEDGTVDLTFRQVSLFFPVSEHKNLF